MPDDSRIEDLRRRVRKDPVSLAFAQLAEELRRARRFMEAVAVCRAGLELYPGYLSARVTLGRCFIDLNRLDDAEREIAKVREVAPENLVAIRALGEIRERRAGSGAQTAAARLQSALSAGPSAPPPPTRGQASSGRVVEGPDATYDGVTFAIPLQSVAGARPSIPPTSEVRLKPDPSARPSTSSGRAVEGPDAKYDGVVPEVRLKPDATYDGVVPEVRLKPDATYDGVVPEVRLKPDATYDGVVPEMRLKPAPSARPSTSSGRAVEGPDAPYNEDSVRTLAALEVLLDAIHVTRASRSA